MCPNGPGAQYPTAGVEDEELASLRVRGQGDPITDGHTKGFGGDGRDTTMVAAETTVGWAAGAQPAWEVGEGSWVGLAAGAPPRE